MMYINRADAIDAVATALYKSNSGKAYIDYWNEAKQIFDKYPCEIIEDRPKGEWIETELDCGKRHIRCNQCWYADCEIPKEKIKDMDYCPQCGAEMESE